jgi:hypothetical protein
MIRCLTIGRVAVTDPFAIATEYAWLDVPDAP